MVDQIRSGDPTPGALDRRTELGRFLRTRRAALKPEDLGLPGFGRRRRVPGLRREEVAQAAGVSVAYYTRLEQGNSDNVSAEVLKAIARALRLSDPEHNYMTQLAKPKPDENEGTHPRPQRLRPALQHLLDAIDGVPAYVIGQRSDILGWNRLAAGLFGNWNELPPDELNYARFTFLSPTARNLFVDWEDKAATIVSLLRLFASRCPDDPQLAALIGELGVKSEDFRRMWATYELRLKDPGPLRLNHPLVGELTLSYEVFSFRADPDQTLITYHAEPGSASASALRMLANWGTAATTPTRSTVDG
ncbi:XRE family transcriptional regulator [Micromonospora sp. KC606]|uniref:helix-turn-helix domain-containing protein n=1 Tax=Micromonospora sp. KC606 TaxID=2530379 RepID=UPI00104CC054|nr:helix-turn-helix transcriptional regulator [Micromonospora sp. KC606]TDC84007.1 XRE family transcriptional regulator [Micromonospora sp. KC606]